MSRTQNLWQDILNRIDSTYYLLRQDTLALGGTSGSGGGSGGRPGGYSGQLAQIHVAGDFTESFLNVSTSGSIGSLLHNLDNARAYLKGTHQFWASSGSPPTDYLNISSGSWHHTSGNAPLRFTGGASPSVQAPASDNRFALLTMNTSGQMQWVYGASAASPSEPTYPSPTSGSLPLWLVYTRSSGSVITQYDRGLASHYIFADARPILDWGLGGTGAATSGSPPGDWMDNAGDVMNFAPTRVYTVGPNGEFSTITAALAASVGDSPSTSARHTIWASPGTYTESFTVGSFQGVVGIGNREVVIDGTVTLNGSVSSISNTRIQPTSGTAIVISGGTPYVFNNSLGPSSGSTISITSGTAVVRNNSFSGTTGVYYTGGTIQSSENFFNSGCPLVINGATVFLDDWMDTLAVTSGTVTLGARASASSITGAMSSRLVHSVLSGVDGITGGFFSGASSDVQWYRGAADTWKTPDKVQIDNSLTIGGSYTQSVDDASTNTMLTVDTIERTSSGTPTAGIGLAYLFKVETTVSSRNIGQITMKWTDATDASRASQLNLAAYDSASVARNVVSIGGNGSAPILGFYGTAPATKQAPTGSRGGNAALASLLTALATIGLITDSTSA